MNIQGSSAGNPAIDNKTFEILQQAQQKQQELADKMIALSVEKRVNQGKNILLGKLVDVRI